MAHDTHFLQRLERVSPTQADLALALYRDPQRIRYLLAHVTLPGDCDRVAIALDDRRDGPHIIVARDGSFVTCLGDGMSVGNRPIINRSQLARLGSKWEHLRDAAARIRERGDIEAIQRRIFRNGYAVAREDIVALSFLQPMFSAELTGLAVDIHERLQHFRAAYRPSRYRPCNRRGRRQFSAQQREQLRAYWQLCWALGHLAAINGEHMPRILRRLNELGLGTADAERALSWPMSRTMAMPTVLRGNWQVARVGRNALPAFKRSFEEAATWTQFIDSSMGLLAIGLRHRRLRCEVAKVLARQNSPITNPESPYHDPTCEPLLQLYHSLLTQPGYQEAMIQNHRLVGSQNLLWLGESLPEGHPLRFATPDEVPADLAFPLMLCVGGSLFYNATRLTDSAIMMPWLAKAELADLYLPASFWSACRMQWQPSDSLELLDGYYNYNGSRQPARNAGKIGRNQRCPCGSARKYKRCCHGGRVQTTAQTENTSPVHAH